MNKKFYDVFPDMKIDGELGGILKTAEVFRVTQSKDRKLITVYLRSMHLIDKKSVRMLEKELAKQLFADGSVGFRVMESFELSSQYTSRSLFEAYKDSIEFELSEYNPLIERIFHRAEVSFENVEYDTAEHVVLTVEDTVVSRELIPELLRILEKVFTERCNLATAFEVKYKEAVKSRALELADQRVLKEAQAIVERARANSTSGTDDGAAADSDEPFVEVKASGEQKVTAPKEDTKSEKKAQSSGFKNSYKGNSSGFRGGFDKLKKSDDKDVIFGRDVPEEVTYAISEINDEIGEVIIKGKVIQFEDRETKKGKFLCMFNITDFTDTIGVKLFINPEHIKEFKSEFSVGSFIKLKGIAIFDPYDHELSISSVQGIKRIPDFTVARMDNSPIKRIELHCHTKMSDMDAVSDVQSIVKRAIKWGHPALAITDHGVVQAFTEANHTSGMPDDFKLLYGVEGYLVDDEKQLVVNSRGQELMDTFAVVSVKTTGYSPVTDHIIGISAVKISQGVIKESFNELVNPGVPIPFSAIERTGISDQMVKGAGSIDGVMTRFLDFAADAVLVSHNAGADMAFINENVQRLGMFREFTVIDTVMLATFLIPEIARYRIENIAKALSIPYTENKTGENETSCLAEIFIKLADKLANNGVHNLDELNSKIEYTPEIIGKMKAYHVIILAKNEIGRVNLYKLVSDSHLKYFRRMPRIPKRELDSMREGLIIGSACEAGELFRALLEGKGDDEIARIVSFYDYLEIQPIGNNEFLKREGRVADDEGLRDFNRKIVELGERFNKPVCATCDVHFLDPQDEVYRRILMKGKGFDDADFQPPLYLHTTDEMLEEFSYLGAEKAEEVVVTNTHYIADQIDKIPPVRPDKCPPVIQNSDQNLRDICYKKVKEIYGENTPEPVKERLERELNSIINNGFAVMYIIAQKLVWKSNEDGYLVGSRGSVGSSLVAFLAGITEVNSLSPHYYCTECGFTDFDSPEVKKFAGMAGCDMPDRNCPSCNALLKKDGFDIPFETFLGFKGDKEPDIDLNFSGDYQSKAHKYTEVIFGAGCTFKAGTVGTLADKTAYGFVKKYYEEKGIPKRRCELERITVGCTGVRRSTGQHPGGIIVLPHGEEIYSFTPIQHPANDTETDIVTTHFDYHSIDHNLLKLDILGHDDPTMIRFLQDLTGVDPKEIPLDDKGVMSLFQNTDALGITPDDIGGCKLGALGIPEFGTDFAMQMLIDTKPQYFSDLVRIAGLSHGTDVWLGNAETLIKEGKATISTAICTRDDIMIYLIQMGVDPSHAFKIMENVRKGKVAKGKCGEWEGWKAEMVEHGVPDWYIWSCEKIQYMFPKAHAAAYVMMAWRIAWCKIYKPLAYYAAYFSIRADEFSYELMCQGRSKLDHYIDDYKQRSDELSPKEQGQLKVMRLVQEMYARGFDFEPIDIKVADAKYFKIIGDKLMPAISSIDGVGINAADGIVEAAKHGEFLSRDDFRERAGVTKTVADLMGTLGLLGDIPESNQISLFDFM